MNDERLIALKDALLELPRYDCTTGGCGDDACCGSYGTMVEDSDGNWLRRENVIRLLAAMFGIDTAAPTPDGARPGRVRETNNDR